MRNSSRAATSKMGSLLNGPILSNASKLLFTLDCISTKAKSIWSSFAIESTKVESNRSKEAIMFFCRVIIISLYSPASSALRVQEGRMTTSRSIRKRLRYLINNSKTRT